MWSRYLSNNVWRDFRLPISVSNGNIKMPDRKIDCVVNLQQQQQQQQQQQSQNKKKQNKTNKQTKNKTPNDTNRQDSDSVHF